MEVMWAVSTQSESDMEEGANRRLQVGLPLSEALKKYIDFGMPKSCVNLSDLYPRVVLDTDYFELQDLISYETKAYQLGHHAPGAVVSIQQPAKSQHNDNTRKSFCNRCGRIFSRPSHRIAHMVAEVCTRPKSQSPRCPVCHISYKGKREYIIVKYVKDYHPEFMKSILN